MVFMEYEQYKIKYQEIQKIYNNILEEQERLFTKTQPNAIRYDKENVMGGMVVNGLDEYLIEKDKKQIDKRLKEARQLSEDRGRLLKLKEKELRESGCKLDIVYVAKYVDGIHPNEIAKSLNYSKSQVYRMLNQIKSEKMKVATKCD